MNETQEERQQRAEEELQQKLRMEKPVAVQIRQLLRNMSLDLATVYAATGTIIDADAYKDDFIGILRPAYRRSANFFGSQSEKELLKDKNSDNPSLLIAAFGALAGINGTTIDEEIEAYTVRKNAATIEFINRSVPQRAEFITETNQKELNNSVMRANAELVTAGIAFTSIQVGNLASKNFRESSLFRGNMIAATEIQNAAEGAKQIEATQLERTLTPIKNRELGALETKKEWNTQGDEVVRPEHRAADLQQVGFRQPYSVGGESLRFPGDTSLGASLGNTINCRCSSIQFLEGSLPE